VSILEPEHIPEAAVKAVRLRQNAEYPSTVQASPYLRAAQAYMLISMPTGTSTIVGVFQAILALLVDRTNSALANKLMPFKKFASEILLRTAYVFILHCKTEIHIFVQARRQTKDGSTGSELSASIWC
jgi:hypothetical protein